MQKWDEGRRARTVRACDPSRSTGQLNTFTTSRCDLWPRTFNRFPLNFSRDSEARLILTFDPRLPLKQLWCPGAKELVALQQKQKRRNEVERGKINASLQISTGTFAQPDSLNTASPSFRSDPDSLSPWVPHTHHPGVEVRWQSCDQTGSEMEGASFTKLVVTKQK